MAATGRPFNRSEAARSLPQVTAADSPAVSVCAAELHYWLWQLINLTGYLHQQISADLLG
jgi:hypothetical protein